MLLVEEPRPKGQVSKVGGENPGPDGGTGINFIAEIIISFASFAALREINYL